MISFEFFDKVFCIHLPSSTDRLPHIRGEIAKIGANLRVEYIHAAPPSKNFSMSNFARAPHSEFGCNLSQMKAVFRAKLSNAQHPLFIEDDVVFSKDAKTKLGAALTELPPNWDILYLGGHPRGPCTRHSDNLAKVGLYSFADAYCIQRSILLPFIDYWFDRISKPKAAYDFILGDFAATVNSYAVYPIICEQRPGASIISGGQDNKKHLITSRWDKWLS